MRGSDGGRLRRGIWRESDGEVVDGDLSGLALGLLGRLRNVGGVEADAVDGDGGAEAGVVVRAVASDGVVRRRPHSLLAELL